MHKPTKVLVCCTRGWAYKWGSGILRILVK